MTYTKETLAAAVAKIDTEEKFIAFLGGLYLSAVLAKNPLYFGSFRNFVAEIVPVKEIEKGDFGPFVPALSSVVSALIDNGQVNVQEGKKKMKMHYPDKLACQKTLSGMKAKYGDKFDAFLSEVFLLFIKQDKPQGRYSNSANLFASRGK